MIDRNVTRRSLGALAAGGAALAACARIPVLPEGPADPMERLAVLTEQLDGAPLLAGNRVEVLDGGAAMFDAAFRAIAAARDHVNIEMYILQDVRIPDRVGPSLFDLLLMKLAEGVAVTILHASDYPHFGCIRSAPSMMSMRRDQPRHITVLPGGRSRARAR